MAGERVSKKEKEKRIFTIQGWIISGVPDYLITKNIQTQYNVSRRQAKYDLQRAYELWANDDEATIKQKLSLRIAELKQDIRSMGEEFKKTPKGMSVLLAFKKEISKLEGLYPAKTHIIQGDKDKPVIITDTFSPEKEARLKQLMEKYITMQNS